MKICANIAVSSRIRFARNFADVNFMSTLNNQTDIDAISNSLKHFFEQFDGFVYNKLLNLPILMCDGFLERHLISKELIENRDISAVVLNEDESISIMIFEEDHIRLQSICKGFSLQKAYDMLLPIDQELMERFSIAYDDKLGFLTSSPANLGTAMRASVMVFIPAVERSGMIEKLCKDARDEGLTFRGIFGEGSKGKGSYYQISNQNSLGLSESDIIKKVEDFIIDLNYLEDSLINKIIVNNYDQLKDDVLRAFGVLVYAYSVDEQEMFNCLSLLKFGEQCGMVDIKNLEVFSRLYYHGASASLNQHNNFENQDEENKARAEFLNKRIKKIVTIKNLK